MPSVVGWSSLGALVECDKKLDAKLESGSVTPLGPHRVPAFSSAMAALFHRQRLLGAPSSPQRDRAPGWRGTEPGARRDGRLGRQICSQVCGLQPLAIWAQPRSRSPSGSGRSQGGLLHPRVALAALTASLAACEGKDCDALEPPRPARRALATVHGQPSR